MILPPDRMRMLAELLVDIAFPESKRFAVPLGPPGRPVATSPTPRRRDRRKQVPPEDTAAHGDTPPQH